MLVMKPSGETVTMEGMPAGRSQKGRIVGVADVEGFEAYYAVISRSVVAVHSFVFVQCTAHFSDTYFRIKDI